jgi:hypothetical protein
MNAQRRETATLIKRVWRVLRKPRKLLEQREVQLKQAEELLERNPEIGRKIPENRRAQSKEIGLRTVTPRFSLSQKERLKQKRRRPLRNNAKMKGGTL